MSEPSPRKIALIGLDAGDVDFIRSHAGELPNLAELFQDGPRPLRSPADALTSAVWPTFATGQGPGHHGVHYPMQWDAAEMTLRRVSEEWLDYEPFWYELGRQGKQVTVLDAPFSHRSRLPVEHGSEVLNWGSQECLHEFHANRPELGTEIRRRFGKHPMGEDVPVQESPARLAKIRDRLVAGARRKGQLARWLYDTTQPDFFFTVFAETHRGGHLLWPEFGGRDTGVPAGALLDVYRAVDQGLGELLGTIDREHTAVVVFSTHGFRPNYTQEHFVLPVMERINKLWRGEDLPKDAAPAGGGNLMQKLRAAVPQRLQFVIAQLLPASVRDGVVRGAFLGGLDWAKTPGFALIASGEGYLRLSIQGREKDGLHAADSAELARYRELLGRCLRGLRCKATGRSVVKDIVDGPAHFPGPRADRLPDLIVLWDDVMPATELVSDELGSFTGELTTGRIGEHRPEGFACFAGALGGLEQAGRIEAVEDLRRLAEVALGTHSAG